MTDQVQIPVAEALRDPQLTPGWLDRWTPWLVATVVLILLSYGPQLIAQIGGIQSTSQGGSWGTNIGCRICHSLQPGADGVGSALAGVANRAARRVPGMTGEV